MNKRQKKKLFRKTMGWNPPDCLIYTSLDYHVFIGKPWGGLATITYDTGYSYDGLSSYIDSAIEAYLLELRKNWENTDTIVVRILQIEAAIVQIEGIIDVTDTVINGSAKNLQLTDKSVPVKGVISCT